MCVMVWIQAAEKARREAERTANMVVEDEELVALSALLPKMSPLESTLPLNLYSDLIMISEFVHCIGNSEFELKLKDFRPHHLEVSYVIFFLVEGRWTIFCCPFYAFGINGKFLINFVSDSFCFWYCECFLCNACCFVNIIKRHLFLISLERCIYVMY